jgi:hypothetical protein
METGVIADTMEGLHMSDPKPIVDLTEIRRKYHAAKREAQGCSPQQSTDDQKSK